ncbi:hypothetical protein CR513_16526, partial [Mucuna pruriens]
MQHGLRPSRPQAETTVVGARRATDMILIMDHLENSCGDQTHVQPFSPTPSTIQDHSSLGMQRLSS